MKIAEHGRGQVVSDPLALNRQCDDQELQRTGEFLERRFHCTRKRLVHHSVCMYSMSRDGHFIIDRHPDSPNIVFAAGLSGHGFKFAPVLGQHMVDLLDEKPDPILDFLRLGDRNLSGEFPSQ